MHAGGKPGLPNLAKFTRRRVPESDYVVRVNRAIDHVVRDPAGDVSLGAVARAAAFSPYHFHRIFSAATGETLNQFVKRIRLERAVRLMLHEDAATLTEIALRVGFSSSSDFSRCFRQRYGVPPSAFDPASARAASRRELQEKMPVGERHRLARLPLGENPDGFEVRLTALPARVLLYVRVQRPFEAGRVVAAADELVAWAEERSLADGAWFGYMWDDPNIVALDQCRYDVAVQVAASTASHAEVNRIEFPAMTVAEVDIVGAIDLEQRAFDYLYGTWLPQSGFVPAAHPAFEAWNGRPFAHGSDHFELRVQIPVTR